jgi:hypothetical protein
MHAGVDHGRSEPSPPDRFRKTCLVFV